MVVGSVFFTFFNFSGKKNVFCLLELIGLEPTTFAMPLQRSSQVSYSPDGFILTENQELNKDVICFLRDFFAAGIGTARSVPKRFLPVF